MNPLHTLPEHRGTPAALMATASRRWFDLVNPRPEDVDVHDIVCGLARIRRWTGQTTGYAPTVLEHSLHVHEVACGLTDDRLVRACALLHDAHEAYVGDVSTPVKQAIKSVWRSYATHPALNVPGMANLPDPWQVVEHTAQQAVLRRFGLVDAWDLDRITTRVVNAADKAVTGYEANLLYGPGTAEAWGYPVAPPPSKRTSPQATLFRFQHLVAALTGVRD